MNIWIIIVDLIWFTCTTYRLPNRKKISCDGYHLLLMTLSFCVLWILRLSMKLKSQSFNGSNSNHCWWLLHVWNSISYHSYMCIRFFLLIKDSCIIFMMSLYYSCYLLLFIQPAFFLASFVVIVLHTTPINWPSPQNGTTSLTTYTCTTHAYTTSVVQVNILIM